MPKHRLLQNIDRAEVDWPKGPASLLTEPKLSLFDNNSVRANSAYCNLLVTHYHECRRKEEEELETGLNTTLVIKSGLILEYCKDQKSLKYTELYL